MGRATPDASRTAIERTVREHWGYILAGLVGQLRDFDLAEDVLQDAAVAALQHWPNEGIPENPRAWLFQTAKRRAIDRFRRQDRFRSKRDQLEHLAQQQQQAATASDNTNRECPDAGGFEVDHRLSLIFTCCHPALEDQARVALTLRTLGGLSTHEISRAFLVPETTMAQRLVRAKRKIKATNIPYRVPPPHLWPERIESVLAVVYFIFNEGYSATSGSEPTRADLCHEAIRLGRTVVELAPHEPEAAGLLALMLLHDSRRRARCDSSGNLITLEHQDRTLWDRQCIKTGQTLLKGALALGRPGPYQIQAAISAVHADAESHAATDWLQIVQLYDKLYELQPSWVVKLNAAVALSFARGPDDGLRALAQLEQLDAVDHYQPFHAARADLLRRAGRPTEARDAYGRALELTQNAAERSFLEQRLLALDGEPPS